jgi:tetratricopeptide (TPR) repeat protein
MSGQPGPGAGKSEIVVRIVYGERPACRNLYTDPSDHELVWHYLVHITHALRQFPFHAALWNNRAILELFLGYPEESLHSVENADRYHPCCIPVLCNKAIILSRLERIDDARKLGESAYRINPQKYWKYAYKLTFLNPDAAPHEFARGLEENSTLCGVPGDNDIMPDRTDYGTYIDEIYDD